MVLKGEHNTTPEMLPIIIPELQNRSIISIVHGHNHFGALTSSGKLLMWGSCYERGQTQVEQPPRVTVPSEVGFDHGLKVKGRVERYCLAAAAGFMHTAALVVNLAGDEVPPKNLTKTTVPLKKSSTDRL